MFECLDVSMFECLCPSMAGLSLEKFNENNQSKLKTWNNFENVKVSEQSKVEWSRVPSKVLNDTKIRPNNEGVLS
jgi:hypothetical protein